MTAAYQPTSPAATHSAVSAGEITADKWTVIAKRTGSHWQWCDERDKTPEAQKSLHALSDANHIIIMHRRVGRGWELVAQLAGPAWRRFQARRA